MPRTENPTAHLTVIADRALRALHVLNNLTTEQFSQGGDRPARKALAEILADCGELDDETAREYGVAQ